MPISSCDSSPNFSPASRSHAAHIVHAAQMLASTLEAAGPAFIKWGQWAATRRDLFPGDVCVALTRLQMNAATHDSAHSVKVIEAAFGHPIGALFDQFDMEPIASGSVAQVRTNYPP